MHLTRRLYQALATLILVCSLIPTRASAQAGPFDAPDLQSKQDPLETILNSDGTINLNTGYSGTLDPRGWRMTTDHYGRPRFTRSGEPISASVASKPDDDQWDSRFGSAVATDGLNDEVFAIAVIGPYVFVGGAFTKVGDKELNHIGRWDGTKWSSLGDGGLNGTDGFVYALAVRDQVLYVGGQFTKAGGTPSVNISQYNLSQRVWAPMAPIGPNGGGLSGTDQSFVGAIAVSGNKIYAGGNFSQAGSTPTDNIAVWDVQAKNWSAVGGGVNGTVNALAANGDDLYAGGNFSAAGGVPAASIARWDGTNWNALGKGVNGFVNAIGVIAPGDTIIVGGSFTQAGDSAAHNIARWSRTKSEWSMLTGVYQLYDSIAGVRDDDGVDNVVRAIYVDGRTVYVSGTFQSAYPGRYTLNRINTNYIASWTELEESNTWWQALGLGSRNGTDGFVNAIAMVGTELYVGGSFANAGGESAPYVAKWSGARWFPLGVTTSGTITTLGRLGDDVYAAGSFNLSTTGNPNATGIARLNDATWEPITGDVIGLVYAMAASGDNLYIGGSFKTAGGTGANNIVRWNKTTETWSALADGVTGGDNPFVTALAVDGDNLYVGGQFSMAGTVAANNIAVWNQTSATWSALGKGIDGFVLALATSGNGDLYAGGRFVYAGDVYASNIARWSGSAWNALDSGTNNAVLALASRDNRIYVGGDFTRVGSTDAPHIAFWDTDSQLWFPIGGGVGGHFTPYVSSIAFRGRDMYVGGYFSLAGSDSASNIVHWDGYSWSALGSGVDGTVRALIVTSDDIHASGSFTHAGDKPSYYFGIWHEQPSSVDLVDSPSGAGQTVRNYPNPVDRSTTFHFSIPASGHVLLDVYDLQGQPVAVVVDQQLEAGSYDTQWDAGNLPGGTYFYRLRCGDRSTTGRLTTVR